MKRLAAILVGLALLGSGCQESGDPNKLRIGTVDVMRVMEERPETIHIRLDWAAQAGNTYLAMSKVGSQAELSALQAQVEKSSESWRSRMTDFMNSAIKEVDSAAATVAKEQNLDIILVDNPLTRPIKYFEGDDVTLDIMVKIESGDK